MIKCYLRQENCIYRNVSNLQRRLFLIFVGLADSYERYTIFCESISTSVVSPLDILFLHFSFLSLWNFRVSPSLVWVPVLYTLKSQMAPSDLPMPSVLSSFIRPKSVDRILHNTQAKSQTATTTQTETTSYTETTTQTDNITNRVHAAEPHTKVTRAR